MARTHHEIKTRKRTTSHSVSGALLLALLGLMASPWDVSAAEETKPAAEASESVEEGNEPAAEQNQPAARQSKPADKMSLMTELPPVTEVFGFDGDLGSRTVLFGGDARQSLYEKGVALDVDFTNVTQGVLSGGEEEDWENGSGVDYFAYFDTGRLDLWPGGLIGLHARSKFGHSVNTQAGNLSPVNFAYYWMTFDEDPIGFYLTEYYLLQAFSETFSLMVGRVEWTGLADQNLWANDEKTQFLNGSLRNDPLIGSVTSTTTHGVAPIFRINEHLTIATFALDSTDAAPVWGTIDGLFDEVSAGAEFQTSYKLGGLPGHARPAWLYDTKNVTDISNPWIPYKRHGLDLPDVDGNQIFNLSVDQYLWMPDKPADSPKATQYAKTEQGVGVFLRYGWQPKDRNPWNQFLSFGVGARGLFSARPNDRFGLGYYKMFESEDLRDQPIVGGLLSSEWGVEVFYNITITPWIQITPDYQYIKSGLPDTDNASVFALRVQMYF